MDGKHKNGKHMKKGLILLVIIFVALAVVPATVLATWPDGSQGGQYAEVNAALDIVATDIGIPAATFISNYNAAITGPLVLPPADQLANCEVIARLIYYHPELTDYATVYINMGCAGLVPIDSQPPVITSVGPSGTIYTDSTTLTAAYHDLPYGSNIGSVTVTLDGNDVSGCAVGPTSVSCNVTGLSQGPHYMVVTVGDHNQPPLTATASSSFNVNLCTGKPALSVSSGAPYWQSYWNYQIRILSVHYTIHNSGPAAKQVTVVGIVATNGVILQSLTSNVGDINVGGSGGFLVNYSVPFMVNHFMTTIYATAKDECNNSYSYPGPYAGA